MSQINKGDKFRYIYNKSYGTGIVEDTSTANVFVEIRLSTVSTTLYVVSTWFEPPKSYVPPNTSDLTFLEWIDKTTITPISVRQCIHEMVDYTGFTENINTVNTATKGISIMKNQLLEKLKAALQKEPGLMISPEEVENSQGFTPQYLASIGLTERDLKLLERVNIARRGRMPTSRGHKTRWIFVGNLAII